MRDDPRAILIAPVVSEKSYGQIAERGKYTFRVHADAHKTQIRQAVEHSLKGKVRIQIASYDANPRWVGKSLDEIAAAEKRAVADLVLEMESHGGARIINFSMQAEDVRFAMQLAWVATASDGSAKIPNGDQPHPPAGQRLHRAEPASGQAGVDTEHAHPSTMAEAQAGAGSTGRGRRHP